MQSIVTLQGQEALCRDAFKPKTKSRRWERAAARSAFDFKDVWAVPNYDAYIRGPKESIAVSILAPRIIAHIFYITFDNYNS
jgi:hypothetical protein